MALQWDITKCNPPEFVDEHERQGFFNSMIYMPMFVGIPNITEDNWREFYTRVHTLEMLEGGFRNVITKTGLQSIVFQPAEIQRWVGLRTNASNMTRRQFMKEKLQNILDRFSKECV